jgi:hypothetical protein
VSAVFFPIRGWLGHVSLETTKRYAEITARMKEAAMKLGEPPIAIEESRVAKRRRLAHGASFSLAATLGLD